MNPLHGSFKVIVFIIEKLIFQSSNHSLSTVVWIGLSNNFRKSSVQKHWLQCSKYFFKLINYLAHHLGGSLVVTGERKEGNLTKRVQYFSECFKETALMLILALRYIFHEIYHRSHFKVLIQHSGRQFPPFHNIDFVDDTYLRHLHVNHCSEWHHGKWGKLVGLI